MGKTTELTPAIYHASQSGDSAIVAEVLPAWIDAASAALHASECAPALRVDDVDVVDALLSELYLALLQLARGGTSSDAGGTVVKRFLDQLHCKLYLWKKSLQELRYRKELMPTAEIVFWPRNNTHVRTHLPVHMALKAHGVSSTFVACKVPVYEQLKSAGCDAVFTSALWPKEIRAARAAGRKSASKLMQASLPKLPTFPVAERTSEACHVIREVLVRGLPLVHEAAVSAARIIEEARPKVLVVGYDITVEGRTACLVARSRDVPTANLMHGSISGNPIVARHVANRVLAYGQSTRRELLARGVPDAQIEVCGAPYLDSRPNQTGRPDPQIQTALGLHPEQPYILVALSGPGHSVSHHHHQAVVDAITELSSLMPEATIAAKLHPKDNPEYYERAKQKYPGAKLQVVANGATGYPSDIFTWLQGCSLLITGASTTAPEAMLMSVPVVTVDFTGELAGVNFIEAGATVHVTSPYQLEPNVRQLLGSSTVAASARDRCRAFLLDMYHALDGCSAERAADALLALQGTGKRQTAGQAPPG